MNKQQFSTEKYDQNDTSQTFIGQCIFSTQGVILKPA